MDVAIRIPGEKFWGTFISPRQADNLYPNGVWCWAEFWSNWDWDNFVLPQLQKIEDMGLNTVSLMGMNIAFFGLIDRATYLARRAQVMDYLLTRGMYAVAWGAGPYKMGGATVPFGGGIATPLSTWVDEQVADAVLMSGYPNCIVYICVDEPKLTSSNYLTIVQTYYNPVKAAVPADFPICGCSISISEVAHFSPSSTHTDIATLDDYCDAFIFNSFGYTLGNAADWAALRTAYPNKDWMVGSCGENISIAPITRRARYQGYADTGQHADWRGMQFWVRKDYVTTSGAALDKYGLFDENEQERRDATTPIKAAIDMTVRYKTLGETTLAEAIGDSDLTFDVTDITALRETFAVGNDYDCGIFDGDELMEIVTITAESGNTATAMREQGGSLAPPATSHAAGAVIKNILTARVLDQLKLDANILGKASNVQQSATLATSYAISAAIDTYVDTGVGVTIGEGPHILMVNAAAGLAKTAGAFALINIKLRNTTDGVDVGPVNGINYTEIATSAFIQSGQITTVYDSPGTKTIKLFAARGGQAGITTFSLSNIRGSDVNGDTRISAFKYGE